MNTFSTNKRSLMAVLSRLVKTAGTKRCTAEQRRLVTFVVDSANVKLSTANGESVQCAVLEADSTQGNWGASVNIHDLQRIVRAQIGRDITIASSANGTLDVGTAHVATCDSKSDGFIPFDTTGETTIPSWQLADFLARTIYATDDSSSKYALGGVQFEIATRELATISTDGRRLVLAATSIPAARIMPLVDEPCIEFSTGIIPAGFLRIVSRAVVGTAYVHIELGSRNVRFTAFSSSDNIVARLESRLIEGKFPKWRDVIGKPSGYEVIGMVDANDLASVMRQVKAIATDDKRGADFLWCDDVLSITYASELGAVCRTLTAIGPHDKPLTLALKLDYQFVLDLAASAPNQVLEFRGRPEPKKVNELFAEGVDFVSVIMPMD